MSKNDELQELLWARELTADKLTAVRQQREEVLKAYTENNLRKFETGATRSPMGDKLQYEGFLNPLVLKRFAEYMHKNKVQADGSIRAADNWQKGIPRASLIDSGTRHFLDWWLQHRGYSKQADESLEEALCGVMFNAMAYLLDVLTEK
jgi:hypothetical protein